MAIPYDFDNPPVSEAAKAALAKLREQQEREAAAQAREAGRTDKAGDQLIAWQAQQEGLSSPSLARDRTAAGIAPMKDISLPLVSRGARPSAGPIGVTPLTSDVRSVTDAQRQKALALSAALPTPQPVQQAAPVNLTPPTDLNRAAKMLGAAHRGRQQSILAQDQIAQNRAVAERDRLTAEDGLATAKAEQELIETDEYNRLKAGLLAEQETSLAEKQAGIDTAVGKLETARESFRGVGKEDPWSGKAIASNIMTIIGASLVGYAGGLQGDPGAGMRMVSSLIEQDMRRQKQKLDAGRAGVQEEQNAVSLARDLFSTQKTQDLASRDLLLNDYREKLLGVGKRQLPEVQAAKLKTQMDQVDLTLADNQVKLRQSISDDKVAEAKDQVGIATTQDKQRQSLMLKQLELSQKSQENKLRPISESTAKQLGDLTGGIELVNKLEESFHEDTGWASSFTRFIPGTDASDYDATIDAFVQHMARSIYGGTPPVAEINAIKKLIPTASEWGVKAPAMFSALRALSEDKKVDMLHSLGTANFDVRAYSEEMKRERPPASFALEE